MAPPPPARQGTGRGSLLIGSGTFVVGCVLALLLQQSSLLQLPIPAPGFLSCPGPLLDESAGQRECHRMTKSGLCVEDAFDAIDDAYKEMWPGTVDLLLRSYVSEKFFLMETLWKSIDQMWPKGIGDVVLVLDTGDERAMSIVPSWVKVYFEENYLKLPGKILQQWSYGWADLYTTADYVAIVDDDVVFNMKVTPQLLFNLTDGLPYVIGSNRHQTYVWTQWTNFLVGKDKYVANFMVQLPFLAPRASFAAFRDHVGKIQPPDRNTFDKAFKWFSENAEEFGKDQIQHAAFGNFLYHFYSDKVHIALEWTEHVPIPRVAAHIPYSLEFFVGQPKKKVGRRTWVKLSVPKVADLYASVAAHYSQEGLCYSLPKGEFLGCDDTKKVQEQVWIYAFDWVDWPLIYNESGTVLYDKHTQEVHCMYWRLQKLFEKGLFDPHKTTKGVVSENLKACIWPHPL